jgi:Uma2 family endonuclease
MSTTELVETRLGSHWTVDLLQQMPRLEGERYEIIDGELHVTTQPHTMHQVTASNVCFELNQWSRETGLGRAISAPGLVYADNLAVAPDVVWISRARFAVIVGDDGKLHGSPELVVEVLSPGKANAERDRETKLALYSRYGVHEYWIVDWQAMTLDVYRREEDALKLVQSLQTGDALTSPLLPGFSCIIGRFFEV